MEGNTWSTARGSEHPLAQLESKPLAGASLQVMLGPKNRFGARYFQIALRDAADKAGQAILLGLYHSGPYPSQGWREVIHFKARASLPGQGSVLSEADIEALLRRLADLIPPGGHMMVEYESDEWQDTRLSIGCGIPYVATPLGSMLFRVGCGVAFKDWYFAEGGSEGPRKLQGYKALNEEHRHARGEAMAAELRSFLHGEALPGCEQLWEGARQRAEHILALLSTDGVAATG